MSMEPGLYCVFQTPGTTVNDGSGLPAVRLSLPPDGSTAHTPLEFAGFRDDGWVGEFNDALLVRVRRPCSMLVTIYHGAGADARAPNLQVVRLAQPVAPPAPAKAVVAPAAPQSVEEAEVAAHIQGRGDVAGTLSAWIGEPGSGRWIEGFSINPGAIVSADDIEYQACSAVAGFRPGCRAASSAAAAAWLCQSWACVCVCAATRRRAPASRSRPRSPTAPALARLTPARPAKPPISHRSRPSAWW